MDKKRKIEIGKVYSAKVGGSWLPMRIDKSLGHGRYEGMDMHSGKKLKVASDAIRGDGQTAKQWHLQHAAPEHGAAPSQASEPPARKTTPDAATAATGSAGAKTADRPAQDAKPRRKRTTGEPGATSRGPSGLHAAARVLAEAGEPLNTKTMVERMLAKGLWSTGGKTPAATIYAAIIREIAVKGADARFRKVERGKCELAR
jgi:hypothetical protein